MVTPDSSESIKIFVSAGSNIEPRQHLRAGCERLGEMVGAIEFSPVYRTAAVGFDGDDFLNLVFAYQTSASIEAVLSTLDSVEAAAGRRRSGERFSSRTLDFDLLMYGDVVVDRPGLKLPRDDIADYAFVLAPMADLAPDIVHPVIGVTMKELWSAYDKSGPSIHRLAEALF